MKFATDFDMVLFDSHIAWTDRMQDKYGDYSIEGYNIKIQGIESQEIEDFINTCLLKYSDEIQPMQSSVDILPKVLKLFNQDRLPIITNRHSYLYGCTKELCKKYINVPFKLFVTNGTERKKLDIILDNDIHYYADDRLKTANTVAPFVMNSFLIGNYKWNSGRPMMPNVIRKNDLSQVYEYLKGVVN